MIKAIIFDLGGVIIVQSKDITVQIISEMFSMPVSEAFVLWEKRKKAIMSGKIGSKEFLEELKTQIGLRTSVSNLEKQWEMLYAKKAAKLNTELLRVIEQLKKHYTVCLLTDTIDAHDSWNRKRGVYPVFDYVFVSYKQGVEKSDPRAYQLVLQKIKVKPEEAVFIDDREENVALAKTLGMESILYNDNKRLLRDLAALDIRF